MLESFFYLICLPCVSVKCNKANRYGLRWTSFVKWLLRIKSKWILWFAKWRLRRSFVTSIDVAVSSGTGGVDDEPIPSVTTDHKLPIV